MGILDNYNLYLCSVHTLKPFLVPKTTPKKRWNTLEQALTHSFFTPIHVTVLCHFSWPVARSHILVILIGLSNTQIFDHDLVKSSYDFRLLLSPHGHNKQSLDYFGGVGYCNSPPHEVLMISRFFAQFLTRVQLSKFYHSRLNQMEIFSLQNKRTKIGNTLIIENCYVHCLQLGFANFAFKLGFKLEIHIIEITGI